uniref:Uncharacterized protein n=1 Tax=Nelumbo nucifera TaxID=4432 RepID=A0A822ZB67_NELNU|nr:TPA_asm: hypothetical protein HUJ06_000592 [Nelumbo nucifera]
MSRASFLGRNPMSYCPEEVMHSTASEISRAARGAWKPSVTSRPQTSIWAIHATVASIHDTVFFQTIAGSN